MIRKQRFASGNELNATAFAPQGIADNLGNSVLIWTLLAE